MAFSRVVSEQIERLTTSHETNTRQLENMADAFELALKEMFSMAATATSLWENGGVRRRVEESTDGTVSGSSRTAVEWGIKQAALSALLTVFNVPLVTLGSLALVDGEGQLVKTENGELIFPFADVRAVAPLLDTMNVNGVVWLEFDKRVEPAPTFV
jgi:hypothetical protein